MTITNEDSILLLCSLGGTPEPLIKTIQYWRPHRIIFIPSLQTQPQVDTILEEYAKSDNGPVSPGCYRTYPVSDAENFTSSVHTIRQLEQEVHEWIARGSNARIVVDFTGGTKSLSAALALVAHRWPCEFSYVGGTQRTKGGVGIVETGSERIVYQANPWNALGYQAIEDACLLFDQYAFEPAAQLLEKALGNTSSPPDKAALSTLQQLCQAYEFWDRFQHKEATAKLNDTIENSNNFHAIFTTHQTEYIRKSIDALKKHLEGLDSAQGPTIHLIHDLIANAQRRAQQGRYDDATARLYRVMEVIAQYHLHKRGINTSKVPIDSIPQPLRTQWEPHAHNGILKLALQDAYKLLHALKDEIGIRFEKEKLDANDSPLNKRNKSILAHGFEPIQEDTFHKLWEIVVRFAGLDETQLPQPPKLSSIRS